MSWPISQTDLLERSFDNQCEFCPIGDKHCPIFLVQAMHNYDQVGNKNLTSAMNYLINEKGICQMRPLLMEPKEEKHYCDRPNPNY